jgi:hypothetical protein
LVRKCEGKRPLERPWHRREGNIRMDLIKTEWEGVVWIHVAQNRDKWHALMNMVMNFWVP